MQVLININKLAAALALMPALWYGLKLLDRLAKQTPEHALQKGIGQP
jgi:hypothetical protein